MVLHVTKYPQTLHSLIKTCIHPSYIKSREKCLTKNNKECHTLSTELRASLVDTGHAPEVVSRALWGDGLGPWGQNTLLHGNKSALYECQPVGSEISCLWTFAFGTDWIMSIEIYSLSNCNAIRDGHNVFTPHHNEKTLFVKQTFLYIRRNVEDSHGTGSYVGYYRLKSPSLFLYEIPIILQFN